MSRFTIAFLLVTLLLLTIAAGTLSVCCSFLFFYDGNPMFLFLGMITGSNCAYNLYKLRKENI